MTTPIPTPVPIPAQNPNPASNTINIPEIIHRLTFSSENIKQLSADDFNLNNREYISMKSTDCMLVLFYVENTESQQLADIWALVARQVAGPTFGAVNMMIDRKIASAFVKLKSDGSNPLHWAALRQYPFILVYRSGWPVAVYNGAREVQAITDYSLTLACEAGYYEPEQIGGSMQVETKLEMGPYNVYRNAPDTPNKIRTESLQYTSAEPLRGFNSTLPVAITGSQTAQQATNVVRNEEAQSQQGQQSLTQNIEQPPSNIALPSNV